MDYLNYEELSRKYPKAIAKYKEMIETGLKVLYEKMSEKAGETLSLPKDMTKAVETTAKSSLSINHRVLYDFFDEGGLHVSMEWLGPDRYGYSINDGPSSENTSRIMAEAIVFTEAFEMLNSQL